MINSSLSCQWLFTTYVLEVLLWCLRVELKARGRHGNTNWEKHDTVTPSQWQTNLSAVCTAVIRWPGRSVRVKLKPQWKWVKSMNNKTRIPNLTIALVKRSTLATFIFFLKAQWVVLNLSLTDNTIQKQYTMKLHDLLVFYLNVHNQVKHF